MLKRIGFHYNMIPLAWERQSLLMYRLGLRTSSLTYADEKAVVLVWLYRYEVCPDHSDQMIVDGEDESCINRCIDQA